MTRIKRGFSETGALLLVMLVIWPCFALAQSMGNINSIIRGDKQSQQPRVNEPQGRFGTSLQRPERKQDPQKSAKALATNELASLGRASSIYILVHDGKSWSGGSGFPISDRLIVTNSHVIEGARTIYIVTQSRRRIRVKLIADSVVQKTGDLDIAVIKSPAPLKTVPLSLTDKVAPLATVYAFGFPDQGTSQAELEARAADVEVMKAHKNGSAAKVASQISVPTPLATSGTIRSVITNRNRIRVISHGAKISGGNSGGPLIDRCGRVIGINTYGLSTVVIVPTKDGKAKKGSVDTGYGYAIASDEIIKFLKLKNLPAPQSAGHCED